MANEATLPGATAYGETARGGTARGGTARGSRPRGAGSAKKETRSVGLAVYAGAALSSAAALIHLWATPEHFAQWWGYGAFIFACAVAQALYAPLLLRLPGNVPLLLAGIAGNVLVVLVYVLTRTYGVPLGPHAGHVEDPGLLGTLATASEVALIFCLAALLDGGARRKVLNGLMVVGALVWALRLAGILP